MEERTYTEEEREEIRRNILREVEEKTDAAMRRMMPGPSPEGEEFLRKLEKRWAREDAVLNALRVFVAYVFFTPLIRIFHIVTTLLNAVLGISALTFFFGVYQLYKKFNGNEIPVSLTAISLAAPFAIMFVVLILELLEQAMDDFVQLYT